MHINQPAFKFLLPVSVLILVIVAFWPGVSGGFLFDDYHNIVTNANVQIQELTIASLLNAAQGYSGGTRQLAMISFALNAYWAGLNPWAYKVTSLLVHSVNAVLVFWLMTHLLAFSSKSNNSQQRLAALAVALVWALHPIQISSALYVVQRMEILCFTFLFASLLLYLHARKQQISNGHTNYWLWLGALLSFVLAGLFKESAVLLPLFTLSLELTVLGFAAEKPRQQRFWRWSYASLSGLTLMVFIFWILPHFYSANAYPGRDFNTFERLLTQSRVLWLYVQQILLPLPQTLYFYYDNLIISRGWLQPLTTLPAALAWLVVLSLAIRWRKRFPLAALGVFWFLTSHFITSNVIGLEMMFEHRNYFSLLGILLIFVELISRLSVRDGPAIKYTGVVALVLGVSFLGVVRAATWGSVLLLATDMASKNPQSARAAMDLGNAYYEISGGDINSPFYQFSATQFERASALPTATTQPDTNLILMHSSGQLPNDILNIDLVWQRYLQRLQTLHMSAETSSSVWLLLEQRMKGLEIDDAHLQQALEITFRREKQPDYRHAQAGDYLLNYLNLTDAGLEHYRQAAKFAHESNHSKILKTIAADLEAVGYPSLATELTGYTFTPEENLMDQLKQHDDLLQKLK